MPHTQNRPRLYDHLSCALVLICLLSLSMLLLEIYRISLQASFFMRYATVSNTNGETASIQNIYKQPDHETFSQVAMGNRQTTYSTGDSSSSGESVQILPPPESIESKTIQVTHSIQPVSESQSQEEVDQEQEEEEPYTMPEELDEPTTNGSEPEPTILEEAPEITYSEVDVPIVLRGYPGDYVWLSAGSAGSPVPNCEVECYFDGSPATLDELKSVDAVMVTHYTPLETDESLIRVLYHSESESIYTKTREDYNYAGSYFDILSTYHQETDAIIQKAKSQGRIFSYIPISYGYGRSVNYFKLPRYKFAEKIGAGGGLATTFISNCDTVTSERNKWVQRLHALGVTVHSYGACGPNHKTVEAHVRQCSKANSGLDKMRAKYEEKICVQSTYKFTFAFENSIDESYVTEKIFDALMSGTLPVYLGAPNIDRFLPTYNTQFKSIIKASDFKSPDQLAKYILKVANDQKLYNSYMLWRAEPKSEEFEDILNMQARGVCEICKETKKLRKLNITELRNRRDKSKQ